MKITKEQYEELCNSGCWDTTEEFNRLLEDLTGIEARSYTGYQYFDTCGNYVGDTSYCSVRDLLNNAYIKIEGE